MKSSVKRASMAISAVAIAGALAFASSARADCPACTTAFIACGQSVMSTFQSCLAAARTRAAAQACTTAASQGTSACQASFNTCLATCTPTN